MDWSLVKKVPDYNPKMFKLVRQLDGLTKSQFAKRAGLTTKRYFDIEAGNVNPTNPEFQAILKSQDHVIETFFEQWPKTEIDFTGCIGVNIPINYYKYKIFRDINPPPLIIVK